MKESINLRKREIVVEIKALRENFRFPKGNFPSSYGSGSSILDTQSTASKQSLSLCRSLHIRRK